MSIRILPLLALVPLLAACVPVPEPQVVAVTPAALPAPSVLPPLASPLPPPTATPGDRPFATATLGSPPPAADGVVPASATPPATPPTAPAAPGRLGTTVASLGSPTAGGLWLETALVDAPRQGRIEYNGKSVTVQLRPSGGEPGSGSQISLEAMRALGAPLTGLPELSVFAL